MVRRRLPAVLLGASGEATFSGLIAGTYDIEFTVPPGYSVENGGPIRRTVTVAQSQEATLSFSLVPVT